MTHDANTIWEEREKLFVIEMKYVVILINTVNVCVPSYPELPTQTTVPCGEVATKVNPYRVRLVPCIDQLGNVK